MKTNFIANETVQFRVFSQSQIEEIVSTSYEILYRVGTVVEDSEILKLLADAGCIIKNKRVFIPQHLISECLSTTPKRVSMSNRNGKLAMVLEKDKIYFGTGSDCVFLLDPYTGERRKWFEKDIEDAARISDYLPNIDFHMSFGLTSDVPTMTYDRYQFLSMVKNTSKPLILTTVDGKGLEDIYNMCCILTDGEDNFRLKPFIALYSEPITPLTHAKEALSKLKFAAKKGIPNVYTPAPNAGATSPVTLAGTIALGAAEYLAGIVFAQLIAKGAPMISGGVHFSMDMTTGVASYGSTEFNLLHAAMTEVCKYLGLPVFSTCGCSSSKLFDGQSALEAMFGTLSAALSGANIIHDIGYLEDGLCGSYEQLVLTNELIGMVKRYISSVKVDKNTLALDVIEKVGPGGNFLMEDHTFANFKNEIFMPQLIDRSVYANWKTNGSKSLEVRVNEKVKEILKEHKPEPIHSDKLLKIEEYMKKYVK
ncbi:MAG: trimethylamine methyltransferase family protein [Actinobacteria bacterium]|nr:trimethylamine methyltransferase family protein [Actinomycetota bacterium]